MICNQGFIMEKNIYEKQNKNQTSEKFVGTNDSRFRGQEHWASSLDSVMMMQPPKAEKICKTGRKLGQFHCVAEMKIDRILNTNSTYRPTRSSFGRYSERKLTEKWVPKLCGLTHPPCLPPSVPTKLSYYTHSSHHYLIPYLNFTQFISDLIGFIM